MGNGGSSFSGMASALHMSETHIPGLHTEKYKKEVDEEGVVKPIHIVGTVTKVAGESLLRSPFGGDCGVACQVSVYKNDGFPLKGQMEYLFTGTEAFRFEVQGHSAEKGTVPPTEPVRYLLDADMSKVTFKLRETHSEQYIIMDKKTREIRSHATDRKWEGLTVRPNAIMFWERHCSSSRKGEQSMLRSMLHAPIPIPRLAKERVLKLGDTVSVYAIPTDLGDGTIALRPTDEGRLVVCNSDTVARALGFKKYPNVDSIVSGQMRTVTPVPMSQPTNSPADSSDDEVMTARSTVERPGRMSGGRDPLSRFGY